MSRMSTPAFTASTATRVVAEHLPNAFHVEGIGDDHSLVTHLLAEQIGEYRLRQGRRTSGWVESRNNDVRRHDGVDALSYGRAEGRQIDARSSSERVWEMTGRPVWLSTFVSPWPGKCLAVAATFCPS